PLWLKLGPISSDYEFRSATAAIAMRAVALLQAAVVWFLAHPAAAESTSALDVCQNEATCQHPPLAGDEMSTLQSEMSALTKPEKVHEKLSKKKQKKAVIKQVRKRKLKKSLKDAWKHRLDDDVSTLQSDLSASTNPEKIQKKLNKKKAKKEVIKRGRKRNLKNGLKKAWKQRLHED
ncbi:ATG18, partial [Symbiodinium sp. CCMP2456]